MRILIATHHLLGYTGSELYTLWLAKSVKQSGHDVYVYSPYVGKLESSFAKESIALVTDLTKLKNVHFDVAHVHHNIIALEVRQQFPYLPIVIQVHGSVPLLEQLPQENIYPSFILCVSERVREHLIKKGVFPEYLQISRNGIDLDWWQSATQAQQSPKRVLILSSRIPEEKETIIRSACSRLGISVEKIDGRTEEKSPEQVRAAIHQSDFVITIGRGALEAMAASRPVLVFDHFGGDGFVTPGNFIQLMQTSFNGKVTHSNYTSSQLQKIIAETYNPQDISTNRALVAQNFGSGGVIEQLLMCYQQASLEVIPAMSFDAASRIEYGVALTRETRAYSQLQANGRIDVFQRGKVYRLWRSWRSIVEYFHKKK